MRFLSALLLVFAVSTASAGEMPALDLKGLMSEIGSHKDKTVVIFWAPW